MSQPYTLPRSVTGIALLFTEGADMRKSLIPNNALFLCFTAHGVPGASAPSSGACNFGNVLGNVLFLLRLNRNATVNCIR
jgi:hypothetical protein